ncbi:MAG: HAMP domain-containing protein [Magnetococcales bacterium]|nr:HAMP domain-containing protein [Magnetococcales bacterium]MBF0116536.1 HAMP domain-containing protein [Magnetococcales bacterium]
MSWHQSLRVKLLWLILGGMLLMGSLFSVQSYQESMAAILRQTSESSRLFGELVTRQLQDKGHDFSLVVESLLNNREMVSAFAARDRQRLAAMTAPFYKERLDPQYKIDQFQFHLPPAQSFFRAHKPDLFGDDLSGFRKTVLEANRRQQAVVGLEVGRAGPGLRVVYPVFEQGKHVGSVEVGGNIGEVFASARKATGLEFAIAIRDEVFRVVKRSVDEKSDRVVDGLVYYEFSTEGIKALPERVRGLRSDESIVVQDKRWLSWSFPLHDFSGQEMGKVLVLNDVTLLYQQVQNSLWMKFLSILVVVILSSLILYSMMRKLVLQPVQQMVDVASEMAEGDLTVQLSMSGQDELGQLGRAVGGVAARLRDLMLGIVAHGRHLAGSSTELGRVAQELSEHAGGLQQRGQQVSVISAALDREMEDVDQAVGAMTGYLAEVLAAAQEMDLNMGTISAAAEEASASLGTVARAAGLVAQGMDRVQRSSERSSSNIGTVASAVEEMNAALNGVRDRCEGAALQSQEAQKSVQANAGVMKQLEASANEIINVVGLVRSVAQQINMLALNAAIEAARAGEAGKGFAVVANEVKELARQTSEATNRIASGVETMQARIGEVTEAMGGMTQRVGVIDTATQGILLAVDEQAKAVDEITRTMGMAAGETAEVDRLVGMISKEVIEVSRSVQEISLGIEEVTRNVTTSSIQVKQTTQSVEKSAAHGERIRSAVGITLRNAKYLSGHMEEMEEASGGLFTMSADVTRHAEEAAAISQTLDDELQRFRL